RRPGGGHRRRDRADPHGLRARDPDRGHHRQAPLERAVAEPAGTLNERSAVLLVNLGTPEAPTRRAVRRFLAQFLSDPRVIEIPRLAWWPILHGIVLNVRPGRSAAKYA